MVPIPHIHNMYDCTKTRLSRTDHGIALLKFIAISTCTDEYQVDSGFHCFLVVCLHLNSECGRNFLAKNGVGLKKKVLHIISGVGLINLGTHHPFRGPLLT